MNRAFLDSGTFHILAISGLNVSLLAGALFALLRLARASPRLAAGASAILVTCYAALAGASASVIRAAVMADVYLLAIVLDRRGDLLNSLALSALAILWWNPRVSPGCRLPTHLPGDVRDHPRPAPLRAGVRRGAATAPVGDRVGCHHGCGDGDDPPHPGDRLQSRLPRRSPGEYPHRPAERPDHGSGDGRLRPVPRWYRRASRGSTSSTGGWWTSSLSWRDGSPDWPWSSVRVFTPTGAMLVTYYAAVAMLLWAFPVVPAMGSRGRSRRWAAWGAVACCVGLGAAGALAVVSA